MKKCLYISILMAVAALFSSCEQEYTAGTDWGNLEIFRGYMQFSTEVSSRAQLATNMRGKTFGVIGYQYEKTTDWGTKKPLAVPMTDFYDQSVNCNAQNGVCTYDVDDDDTNGDQFKQWEESHYSFFAYYPYNAKGVTLSVPTATNTPTLTFKYPWISKSGRIPVYYDENNNDMYDLMTAEDIDCDGSKNVKLDFQHRLFALEILANNYNETEYKYLYDTSKPVWVYKVDTDGNIILENGNPVIDTDANGNPIQDENPDGTPKYEILKDANGNYVYDLDKNGNKQIVKDASTTINRLSVTISGLQYDTMTIPLSKRSEEPEYISRVNSTNTTIGSKVFDIQDIDLTIPAFNEPIYDEETGKVIAGNGVATSISKMGASNQNGYLMFIPQEEPLEFELLWKEIDGAQSVDRKITSTVKFEEGYLYQLIVNFVGSGITIHLIRAGAWDDRTVTHTFE
jgi:hypothetical protein